MTRRSDPPRVALIAVAADEAAYVANFLYHHLSVGFAPIVIAVNRTRDGTAEIVRRIARCGHDVRLVDGDALGPHPRGRNFQQCAYWHILDGLRAELGPHDYVMPLDVDEYWTGIAPGTVQNAIAAHGEPDTLSFNWFIQDNDDARFLLSPAKELTGFWDIHVKTAWRAALAFRVLGPHNVAGFEPAASVRRAVASGLPLKDNTVHTEGVPTAGVGPFVLHMMYRSVPEYLAALGRGNPDDDLPFKANRHGYRHHRIRDGRPATVTRPWFDAEAYAAGYARFVEDAGIASLIEEGRTMTLKRALTTIERYRHMPREQARAFEMSFRGVDTDRERQDIERMLLDSAETVPGRTV